MCGFFAGPAGFEPASAGVKVLCLTAWRYPYNVVIISQFFSLVKVKRAFSLAFLIFCTGYPIVLYENAELTGNSRLFQMQKTREFLSANRKILLTTKRVYDNIILET